MPFATFGLMTVTDFQASYRLLLKGLTEDRFATSRAGKSGLARKAPASPSAMRRTVGSLVLATMELQQAERVDNC